MVRLHLLQEVPNAARFELKDAFGLTPLQQGSFDLTMGAGGYHAGIGLLSQWDVLYLTTSAAAAYKGLVFNGYSFGRYGIHYRDEATNKPAAVCDASRPYLNISQTNSGIHDVGSSQTGTPAFRASRRISSLVRPTSSSGLRTPNSRAAARPGR